MIQCICTLHESKEGFLENYMLQFDTFHLPTRGLNLLDNHLIYHFLMISLD